MLRSSFSIPKNETCDYLVIGGGPAGLTLAIWLAEQGARPVAVVKARGFYKLNDGRLSHIRA